MFSVDKENKKQTLYFIYNEKTKSQKQLSWFYSKLGSWSQFIQVH